MASSSTTSTIRPVERRSSRSTATSARPSTTRCTTSTTSCAPACADFNYAKRGELADLTGTVALLTGGRVKIGYQAGIKLLRCGASLIVATRFPRDAAARYAAEPDFDEWGDRLEVFGLDLRHTPSVEAFCHHVLDHARSARLHRQQRLPDRSPTARLLPPHDGRARPPRSTRSTRTSSGSSAPTRACADTTCCPGPSDDRSTSSAHRSPLAGLTQAAAMSQTPLLPDEVHAQADLFPAGRLDQDLQQVDLRDRNSWRLLLHEVSSVELLETQLVNAVAPFVINARLGR